MRKALLTSLLLTIAALINSASAQFFKIQPLAAFGTNGDGSIRPGDVDFLNSSNQIQRGLAWNPVTGHVLVACRTNSASPTIERVLIVDGATGTNIGQLDMSSLALGGNMSFLISLIGVADDGAIYAGNISNVQLPAEYRLYRWANETAAQELVWYGDPAGGNGNSADRRWGDTMAVRGAGLTTQVLIASRGTVACVLRPVDSSMASFYPTTLQTDTAVGALGYGLTFGSGDTFWGTSGANGNGPLLHLTFDLTGGSATTLQSFYATNSNFSATVSPIKVLPGSNWLAGIDTRPGPDFVRLYDISNLIAPLPLLDRTDWVLTNNNNNFAGALAFTTNNPPVLYALDSDNGIMAFTLTPTNSNPLPPSIILSPLTRLVQVGSNVLFSAAADGDAPLSYQWYFNTNNTIPNATNISLTVSNAQISNSGKYTFVATNVLGSATSSVATLTVLSNSATFLAYEPFNYAAGSLLGTNQTIPGPGGWLLNSGTSGTITNENVTVRGLVSPIGNAYTWGSANSSERLPIGTNVSGTLFFSFALHLDDLGSITPSGNSETMAGFTTGTGTSFGSKINIVSNDFGVYQIGIYKGGGVNNGALATNLFRTNEIVFVVSRYSFNPNSSTDDTCDLWLNPDPVTFGDDTPPTATIAATGAGGNDLPQLDRFFLRRNNGFPRRTTIDELRLGYTWTDVTPKAAAVLTITPGGTNVVITWPTYEQDFILQGSPTIAPATWTSVTNQVNTIGTDYSVTVKANSGNRFFRLIK
jgi:hypothetical protein